MLIDSHAHLDSPQFQGQLDDVLSRARDTNVRFILSIVCAGEDVGSIEPLVKWIESTSGVYAAIGVHPHDAKFLTTHLEDFIADLMSHPKVLGWGEIGLDFYYDNSPREVQEEAFRRQLRRARKAEKPVIVHSREAAQETLDILEKEFTDPGCPGAVMHCFTYDQKIADHCLALGLDLGFGGIVTFPRSIELQEVASCVPDDRFLIETDSPYLAPVPYRGKCNEPAFVMKVAEKLAELRDTTPGEVADQSGANFCRLFGVDSGCAELL